MCGRLGFLWWKVLSLFYNLLIFMHLQLRFSNLFLSLFSSNIVHNFPVFVQTFKMEIFTQDTLRHLRQYCENALVLLSQLSAGPLFQIRRLMFSSHCLWPCDVRFLAACLDSWLLAASHEFNKCSVCFLRDASLFFAILCSGVTSNQCFDQVFFT